MICQTNRWKWICYQTICFRCPIYLYPDIQFIYIHYHPDIQFIKHNKGWNWCPNYWGLWNITSHQISVGNDIPNTWVVDVAFWCSANSHTWVMFNWDIYQPLHLHRLTIEMYAILYIHVPVCISHKDVFVLSTWSPSIYFWMDITWLHRKHVLYFLSK